MSWNGFYEFYMFEKRPEEEKALCDDFWEYMQEEDEDESETGSEHSSSPRNSVTWANEMQLTEGVEQEEHPFSEDEESVQIDFPEEDLNDWDNAEWRANFAIAINEAYTKVYEHNERIKNDPAMARKKPIDIDPFWGFALQQIKERDREEEENAEQLQEVETVEIEDEEAVSEATSNSIHAYDSNSNTIITDASLNEAVIGINSELLNDTDARDELNAINDTADEDDAEIAAGSDVSAEVLLIERQEDVIVLQDEQSSTMQDSRSTSSLRFNFEDFKARLMRFKNRCNSEGSAVRNKRLDSN